MPQCVDSHIFLIGRTGNILLQIEINDAQNEKQHVHIAIRFFNRYRLAASR